MRKVYRTALAFAAFVATPTMAQNVDCNQIKNNSASKERCLQGQREARKAANEAKLYNGLANLRDGICVVDNHGGELAALRAGWLGKIVYRGTRAAADAISHGASSCKK